MNIIKNKESYLINGTRTHNQLNNHLNLVCNCEILRFKQQFLNKLKIRCKLYKNCSLNY